MSIRTIIYPVSDLLAAKPVYTAALGTEPAHDSDYYVGYELGDLHVGLAPGGTGPGPTCFVHVADINVALAALVDAGATPAQEVRGVGGGRLTATVTDADGNLLGVLQDPAA